MLATFIVMLASRDPASGAGVDLSWASLPTVNGAFTLLTVLLGVAAAVLAIAAFGRRNTRKVFAAVGLGGALMFLTVTATLMMSAESELANWAETSPKLRKPASYPRLFPIVENGKWGFIDVTGRVVIEPQFDYARPFFEGFAAVNVGGVRKDAHAEGGKWGFIDTSGAFVINPQYDDVGDYAEGLAFVRRGLTCAFLDTRGDTVFVVSPSPLLTPRDYAPVRAVMGLVQAWKFSQGFVSYAQGTGNSPAPVGFLDRAGRVAVAAKFSAVGKFSEGLAAVRVGQPPTGKWGYINNRGRWVIRPQFDNAGPFSEGLAAVEVGATYNGTAVKRYGKEGYIDRRGKLVINPQFDNAEEFTEGLAAVQFGGIWDSTERLPSGGKYGFIDHHGAYTIQPRYDGAGTFTDGRASVRVARLEGYVDKKGAFAVQPQYAMAASYREGLAIVVANDPHHAFNPLVYLRIIRGYGGPPTPDCGPWAYIDTAGRFIWKSADWPADNMPPVSASDRKR